MSLSFNSSVSGIRASLSTLAVSAHNTANINTDGFKKQRTSLSEGNNGGVVVRITESTQPGPVYRNVDETMVEASNVDVTEEIAGEIGAKHLFSANVAALKTSNDVQKSLLARISHRRDRNPLLFMV